MAIVSIRILIVGWGPIGVLRPHLHGLKQNIEDRLLDGIVRILIIRMQTRHFKLYPSISFARKWMCAQVIAKQQRIALVGMPQHTHVDVRRASDVSSNKH